MKLKVFKALPDWPIEKIVLLHHPVPVQVNFLMEGVIGSAKLTKEGDCIYADVHLVEGVEMEQLQLLTPSIKIEVDLPREGKLGGAVVAVGFCSGANVDDNIRTISEQLLLEIEKQMETEGTVHFTKLLTVKKPVDYSIYFYDNDWRRKADNMSVEELYDFALQLHNQYLNNGGVLDYSDKLYGYLCDELEDVEVGTFNTPSDSDYARHLAEIGYILTPEQAKFGLIYRIDTILNQLQNK